MSNPRYLEVDSTYRNRNEYPQAGRFVVPISQTGRKGPIDAVDPVSEAGAENVWVANAFDVVNTGVPPTSGLTNAGASLIVSTVFPPPTGAATGNGLLAIMLTCTAGHAQIANGYYNNAVLRTTNDTLRSRIADYQYKGTTLDTNNNVVDRLQIRLFSPISIAPGDAVNIEDPTDLTTTISPQLFVPVGKNAPNAYPGTQIHNITKNEYRPVKDYSAATHLLAPDTSGSAVTTPSAGPVTNWTLTDTYAIRPIKTGWCGQLDPTPTLPADFPNTTRVFNLPVTGLNPITQGLNLVGSFLEVEYERSSPTNQQFQGAPTTSVMILAPGFKPYDDYYVGCQIRLSGPAPNTPTVYPSGEMRTITNYDGATGTITVSPPFTIAPTAGTDNYQIICGGVKNPRDAPACTQEARRIVKYVDYRDNATNNPSGTTTIDFPASASDQSGFYTDLFIRVDPGGINNLRQITNYVVTRNANGVITSRRATVNSSFGVVGPSPAFTITSGIVSGPFTFALSEQKVCILPFSYDNLNPFVYTGSLVSQQDVVCYEIELLNLVLPNQTLAVGEGGFISYYPFVYVQLMNVDASGGHLKNIIYSNNPNATNMMFRAAVDDVPNPINSTFIKIDGDGAVQTVKFKPNDNLLFAVYLPDGEVFQTLEPEWCSPCIPNPKAQISAYFSIKRVS